MNRLFAKGRSWIGDAVRRAVAGDIGQVRDDIEALSGRIDLSSPLLWNDLGRPVEPSLPSPHELVRDKNAVAAISEYLALLEGSPQHHQMNDPRLIREVLERDTWPIPSPGDREKYFIGDDLAYAVSGLLDAAFVTEVAQRHGVAITPRTTVLDFGCASGRMLRAFRNLHPDAEVIGIDLNLQAVRWARENLGEDVHIVQGTTMPILPFETSTIDVIFAGSVFTHVSDFEEAWLMELRRVLHPDGVAILTIHPERTWKEMCDPRHSLTTLLTSSRQLVDPPGVMLESLDMFHREMPGQRVVFTTIDWPINNTNVVHSDAWISKRWGALYDIRERVVHAHGHHQDAIVLKQLQGS